MSLRQMYVGYNIDRQKTLADAERQARAGDTVIFHGHAHNVSCLEVIAGCFRYEGNECKPWEGGPPE